MTISLSTRSLTQHSHRAFNHFLSLTNHTLWLTTNFAESKELGIRN